MNQCCIICKKRNFSTISKHVRDSKRHKIIRCENCSHIQLFPLLTKSAYKKFYDENRQIKNIKFNFKIEQLEKKSNFDVNRRSRLIKKQCSKKSKILEIGSGNGFLLKNLYEQGYNIRGIEISQERRRISQIISDAPVIDFDILSQTKSIGQFDTVVMFQVLEHIADPISFLKKISKMLKKNGKLIIEVPNIDDFQLELNQFYKDWFWQKAHVSYFSVQILSEILAKSKFHEAKIIGIQRYSIENMFSWKLNGKPQARNPSYNMSVGYDWIDKHYKKYLEKKLICDTIIAIAKK